MNRDTMLANLISMQKPCSTSRTIPGRKSGWTKTDKIVEAVRSAGDYQVMRMRCCVLFSKVPFGELFNSGHIILVSSHADFVPSITKPFCYVSQGGRMLKGTFDNSITNAAVINMMQEGSLPDNVVFALTGDEETGGCYGAKEAVGVLETLGIEKQHIYPLALDVTFEGYRQPVSFSVENVTKKDSAAILAAEALAGTGQLYVCSHALWENFPANTPPERRGRNYSMYDEGAAYQKLTGHGFSFCIPCRGNMHSNAGVFVKTSVYIAYNRNLAGFIGNYDRELERSLTEHKSSIYI